jgi:hypothetical protein
MHTSCRSRRARVVALGGAAALAALAGGGVAGSAQAAWLSAGSASGIGAGPSVLAAGAGEATVTGTNVDSTLFGTRHTPGTSAFSAPFAITAANEEATAPIGAGGAVVSFGDAGSTVRRLHADGTSSAPVVVGTDETSLVGDAAAVASGGAALALVADEDDQVQVWRQPSEGAPFAPIGGVIGADATLAAIAPTGPDSFVAIFAEPRPSSGAQLRAVRVSGTTVGAVRTVDTQLAGDEFSYESLELAGSTAVFVVVADDGATLRAADVDLSSAGAVLAGPLADDDSFLDTSAVPVAGGGTAVAWTQSAGDATSTGYALALPGGAKLCSTPEPFGAAVVVDRGGPLLVGLGADGTVGTVPVAGDCAPGTPVPGPDLGAGDAIAAGVDGDGALVVGVSSTQQAEPFSSNTVLAVDDATAPSIDLVQVPATVDAGASFGAYVRASDAWGLGAVSWSVEGKPVATGADATIPAQTEEGPHTYRVTVKNAAGLEAGREGAFVVVPSGTAPPPPPPPPPPGAPPTHTPRAPPPGGRAPAPAAPAARPGDADTHDAERAHAGRRRLGAQGRDGAQGLRPARDRRARAPAGQWARRRRDAADDAQRGRPRAGHAAARQADAGRQVPLHRVGRPREGRGQVQEVGPAAAGRQGRPRRPGQRQPLGALRRRHAHAARPLPDQRPRLGPRGQPVGDHLHVDDALLAMA